MLLVAGFALVISGAPHPAAAEANDPMAAATQQKQNCELMGGTGTVRTLRTPSGNNASAVSCAGGIADGVSCYNDSKGTTCYHPDVTFTAPVEGWHVRPGDVLAQAEGGSTVPIKTVISAFNAGLTSDVALSSTGSATARTESNSDTHATTSKPDKHHKQGHKGKRGKHGKHRGKDRRR